MEYPTQQTLRAHEADRQAREVYRYFQPTNPAALNAAWLPRSTASDFAISEKTTIETSFLSSPNATLTSFAQQAVIRLHAQRAFITILNHHSQFIIAEATKTTNLRNSKFSTADGDGLFSGTSTLPNIWNICQETVAIASDTNDDTYPVLVVNDLTQEDRFRRLPFVEAEPHSRFYAGAPLTTDSGINLGCLFVLDSQPREGLSDCEKDALGTMAAMAMDYLHVSRQAVEGRRASRLSQGLRLFVDGKSSFADNVYTSRSNTPNSSPVSRDSSQRWMSRSVSSQNSGVGSRVAHDETTEAHAQTDRSLSPVSHDDLNTGISTNAATSLSLHRGDSGSSACSDSNDWLFQRAANLLRQGLNLNSYGGVIYLKISDVSSDNLVYSDSTPVDSSNSAPLLSLSTKDNLLSSQKTSLSPCAATTLDKVFLKQLTHRYPKGRLWSFHRDGSLSTSDEEQTTDASQKHRNKHKASENTKLNTYFPDACQVMFVPLWNATDSQWFAGCFCWTPQPTRVFSRAVDLASIFGFSSSIMTEYSRIESAIADRQKGDFISSISHELRSPLHGVLAATEFLGDTRMDDFQVSLVETINACGRTLLDTMNQVLDFSKIKSLQRRKRRPRGRKNPWKTKPTEKSPARMDPFVETDVAILTEEVVDSVCLGHFHMRQSTMPANDRTAVTPSSPAQPAKEGKEIISSSDVEIVIDIPSDDWVYKVQPGSLRRLIMNLLGNALKYTERGLVSVCLEATRRSKGHSRDQEPEDMVTLTISDTGKGISSEYLRTRLYTPFSQEDTLSVGAGLGLSIVRDIVSTFNGSINIQSKVGQGTMVRVLIPLRRPIEDESPSKIDTNCELKSPMPSSQLSCLGLTNKRAAFCGMDPPLIENQFWSSIAQYVTDWYGMHIVPWSANGDVDFVFVDAAYLSAENVRHLPATLPNLLVFCNDWDNSSELRKKSLHLADSLVILRRPCGPQKLARGILGCLNSTSSTLSNSDSLIPAGARPVSQSGPRVLLVDDNDINLRLMSTFMKKRKVPVLDVAKNGREAVGYVERMLKGYDLIFMDISMPIMDGNEATRAIRTMEKARDGCVRAKIIAFTGLSSSHAESKALDSGVDLFLTKPVSFKEVSRLMNGWDARKAN
ncbi:hypothetical protein N7481_004904 [Penicillium waksmanii]|uniref:uncharacterized protein n=1 Tax=Penicillium waksmanii TaxID=69791 RepID=UPI002546E865|nr:uncharacterized protein N7481_004904 [Penicillium waksmanii]KAJ5989694.1 hypothetical protein N7481_004904 [Penicillium waksmanii]